MNSEIKKSSAASALEDFLISQKKSLFFFIGSFNATGTDSCFGTINFLALQINLKFSQGFNIGMTHGVACSRTASTYFTNSTHKIKR